MFFYFQSSNQIKVTHPNHCASLRWSFYLVNRYIVTFRLHLEECNKTTQRQNCNQGREESDACFVTGNKGTSLSFSAKDDSIKVLATKWYSYTVEKREDRIIIIVIYCSVSLILQLNAMMTERESPLVDDRPTANRSQNRLSSWLPICRLQ